MVKQLWARKSNSHQSSDSCNQGSSTSDENGDRWGRYQHYTVNDDSGWIPGASLRARPSPPLAASRQWPRGAIVWKSASTVLPADEFGDHRPIRRIGGPLAGIGLVAGPTSELKYEMVLYFSQGANAEVDELFYYSWADWDTLPETPTNTIQYQTQSLAAGDYNTKRGPTRLVLMKSAAKKIQKMQYEGGSWKAVETLDWDRLLNTYLHDGLNPQKYCRVTKSVSPWGTLVPACRWNPRVRIRMKTDDNLKLHRRIYMISPRSESPESDIADYQLGRGSKRVGGGIQRGRAELPIECPGRKDREFRNLKRDCPAKFDDPKFLWTTDRAEWKPKIPKYNSKHLRTHGVGEYNTTEVRRASYGESVPPRQSRAVSRKPLNHLRASAASCADQLPMNLLARNGSTRGGHRGGARTERECGEDEGEMCERWELHFALTDCDLNWDERWVTGWSAQSVLYLVIQVAIRSLEELVGDSSTWSVPERRYIQNIQLPWKSLMYRNLLVRLYRKVSVEILRQQSGSSLQTGVETRHNPWNSIVSHRLIQLLVICISVKTNGRNAYRQSPPSAAPPGSACRGRGRSQPTRLRRFCPARERDEEELETGLVARISCIMSEGTFRPNSLSAMERRRRGLAELSYDMRRVGRKPLENSCQNAANHSQERAECAASKNYFPLIPHVREPSNSSQRRGSRRCSSRQPRAPDPYAEAAVAPEKPSASYQRLVLPSNPPPNFQMDSMKAKRAKLQAKLEALESSITEEREGLKKEREALKAMLNERKSIAQLGLRTVHLPVPQAIPSSQIPGTRRYGTTQKRPYAGERRVKLYKRLSQVNQGTTKFPNTIPEKQNNREVAHRPFKPSDGFFAVRKLMADGSDDWDTRVSF
ncbi:hypothetical protein DFH09DRAFT_1089533 [Mycena vulgaris]|nr:hypothetical protein DFH09DRAFT_1089533 [Mycena vulgaris]